MSSRFAFVPAWVEELVDEVRKEHFSSLANARILVLFDERKRLSLGAYVLGRMKLAKDLEKLLAEKADGEQYDYVLSLDYEVFVRIDHDDQVRLIRHELRHCLYDPEDKAKPYKIAPHEIEDFHAEVALNYDSPEWKQRLLTVAESIYEADVKPAIPDDRQRDLFRPGSVEEAAQGLVDSVKPGNSLTIIAGSGKGVHIERPAAGGPAKVTPAEGQELPA